MSDVDLRLGRWQDVLADVECDALIVDAPYSSKTHSGHDGACAADEGETWLRSNGRVEKKIQRRDINYSAFTDEDVRSFVRTWGMRTRGWFVTITDDVLAPVWADALAGNGRYVFAPLPLVERGSRVRLTGDGPSSWTCWIVVARPRTPDFVRWGTLPGAYVDSNERKAVVGGKPLGLMRSIVRDYTRPGDLICDPCAGGGTTLLAARMEGRRAVGAEMMPEHYEIARRRLAHMPQPTERQPALFGGES